jgi:hypothetical protein
LGVGLNIPEPPALGADAIPGLSADGVVRWVDRIPMTGAFIGAEDSLAFAKEVAEPALPLIELPFPAWAFCFRPEVAEMGFKGDSIREFTSVGRTTVKLLPSDSSCSRRGPRLRTAFPFLRATWRTSPRVTFATRSMPTP